MATEEKAFAKMDVEEEVNDEGETNTSNKKQPKEEKDSSDMKEAQPKKPGNTSTTSQKEITSGAAANPHYRVKISGLPRFYTPTDPLLVDFKKLLHDELGLDFKYIRSPKKGNSWLYITFYNQVNQEKALKLLKHYIWKGRTLICTLVVADVLKRKQEDSGQELSKRPKLDIPIEEQMLMATIPYHSVSYEEQLLKKNEEAQCLFKWLAECMEKKTPQLIGYIDQEIEKNTKIKLPFQLDEVRASPVIDGYRNKCEFRIGLDPQTKKVVVGYRVDNQEDDNIAVAPPDSLRHLPKEMINIVKVFENFVQESPYQPQVTNHDIGVWRLLHVRINKAKQIMVVVLINPTILDNEKLVQLKLSLIKYFSEGPASGFNIVSLYLHTDSDVKTLGGDKLKRPQGQLELLWGESHMAEQLLDLQLDIDPNFYFQNNTWGAEELYKAVKELAGVDEETTVLDLCCGSGGMGMMFAKHCKEVIGVEVMDVNVDDAKKLAAKNGLTNCEFLQGAVDDLFPELERKLKGKKVVPILDPPRAGISAKLILSLRKMKEAERIIYVCSNHKLPSKNIMDMSLLEGENKVYLGTSPFFPTRIIPVDISPHSLRCELVIRLDRLDIEKLPKPKRFPPAKTAKCLYYAKDRTRGRVYKRVFYDRVKGRDYGGRGPPASRRVPPSAGNSYRSMAARDSLYPPPLRGNLYQSNRRGFGNSSGYDQTSSRPFGHGRPSSGYDFAPSLYNNHPRREFDNDLNRYSEFRRDVEDAIDSSYPPRRNVSQRLAMANAMLEQGLRLASEAMAEDLTRPPVPSPAPLFFRRPRDTTYNEMRGGGMGNSSWDQGSAPVDSWKTSWNGDNYDVVRSRGGGGGGNRGFGGPAKGGNRGFGGPSKGGNRGFGGPAKGGNRGFGGPAKGGNRASRGGKKPGGTWRR